MKAFFTMAVVAGLASTNLAHAKGLECYANPNTDAHQCIDPAQVREEKGIRSAPLFTGGPKEVRPSGFSVHVNCATRVIHLKDRDGVSFAGSRADTRASISLSNLVCDAPLKTSSREKAKK